MWKLRTVALACCGVLLLGPITSLSAYENPAALEAKAGPAKSAASKVDSAASLPDSEQRLAEQYRELERVLMVMRDLTKQNDPNRAALIEKALKESGDRQVDNDLAKIVESLKTNRLSTAIERQSKVERDLQDILDMLQSEIRPKPSKEQADRLKDYLNRVSAALKEQKALLGRNEAGGDMQSLSGEQGALAQKVGKLSGDIRKNEEKPSDAAKPGGDKPNADKNGGDKPSGDKSSGDKNSGDKSSPGKSGDKSQPGGKSGDKGDKGDKNKGDKNADKNPGDKGDKNNSDKNSGQPSDGKPSDGKPSQGQPSQGQPSQGQPSDGQPSEGQSQDSQQQPQDENPARKRLDAAQRNMEDAQKKLNKAQRSGSKKDMEEAIHNLDQAKAELEEILRQLREEEMRRLLAMLEVRFVEILRLQRDVNDNTLRLDRVAEAERSHGFDIESGKLSGKETDIIVKVDSTLRLLREEGSAVATPEAVDMIRLDMEQVMQRLARSKTNAITQDIERDIVTGLEQVIENLKKARKDAENKKQPPGPSQNGQPQDPPLIEKLSELKMIRFMEERIRGRTQKYSKLVQGEQAEKADLLESIGKLGEQQQRVYRVTRDLDLGKNQ